MIFCQGAKDFHVTEMVIGQVRVIFFHITEIDVKIMSGAKDCCAIYPGC